MSLNERLRTATHHSADDFNRDRSGASRRLSDLTDGQVRSCDAHDFLILKSSAAGCLVDANELSERVRRAFARNFPNASRADLNRQRAGACVLHCDAPKGVVERLLVAGLSAGVSL